MFVGMALFVRLFVYAGLTCIWLYVYFTHINLHGGAWKMAKKGESQMGSVSFLSSCKRSIGNLRK